MDHFYAHLRQRRDAMQAELSELAARTEVLEKQIAACDVLLSGAPVSEASVDAPVNGHQVTVPASVDEGIEAAGVTVADPTPLAQKTKAQFLFDAIVASGYKGITGAELWHKMTRAGLSGRRNYVYNVASRFKEAKRIEQRGTRYYALAP